MSATEGCVRAVTAVAETIKDSQIIKIICSIFSSLYLRYKREISYESLLYKTIN